MAETALPTVSIPERAMGRTGARKLGAYSQWVLVYVYVSLAAEFYTEIRGDGFLTLIGNFNLWAGDVALLSGVPMVMLAIRRPDRSLSLGQLILLGWSAVVAFWILRGSLISAYDTAYYFRVYSWHCAALFAFGLKSVRPAASRRIILAFIWTGLALTALALLRVMFGTPLFIAPDSAGYWAHTVDHRTLGGEGGLVLGEAMIFAFSLHRRRAKSKIAGISSDTLTVIVLAIGLLNATQRTGAAAAVLGFVVVAIGKSRARLSRLYNPTTIVGGSVVAVLLGTWGLRGLVSVLPTKLMSANALGDFYLRILIWVNIAQNYAGWSVVEKLFGKADPWNLFWYFGSAFGTDDRVDTRSAHDAYFGALLFTGAVGVFLLVGFAVVCFVGAVRAQMRGEKKNLSGLPPSLVMGLIAILIIYGVSYEWLYEQGIVLGLCAAGWSGGRRSIARRAKQSARN